MKYSVIPLKPPFKTLARLFLCCGLLFISGACSSRPQPNLIVDCEKGLPGWSLAVAVTPDVVPPCNTGSVGNCTDKAFVYVNGTGWCRPDHR
ncbi:hypothetical protein NON20_24710 (plasmid) [Synechocystis sp. B12]|nr:hypothetical protein NON20_24710 [Synechocystis sp. B12]